MKKFRILFCSMLVLCLSVFLVACDTGSQDPDDSTNANTLTISVNDTYQRISDTDINQPTAVYTYNGQTITDATILSELMAHTTFVYTKEDGSSVSLSAENLAFGDVYTVGASYTGEIYDDVEVNTGSYYVVDYIVVTDSDSTTNHCSSTSYETAVSALQGGETITLYGDVELQSTNINITTAVTINGNGYKMKVADSVEWKATSTIVFTNDATINDLTVDANSKARVMAVKTKSTGGYSTLTLNYVTLQGGYHNYCAGLLVTGLSNLVMSNSVIESCTLVNSALDEAAQACGAEYQYELTYSRDLWLGSQTYATLTDCRMDYALINANNYTHDSNTSDKAGVINVNGGEITHLFLVYDYVATHGTTEDAQQCVTTLNLQSASVINLYLDLSFTSDGRTNAKQNAHNTAYKIQNPATGTYTSGYTSSTANSTDD